jgi:hypothetical protein
MRARLLLLLLIPLLAGCPKDNCLSGGECTMPTPCEGLAFSCDGGFVELVTLQPGDPIPGGLDALASPGDLLLRNDRVEIVVEALEHPHYLEPTGGGVVDFGTTGGANDSLRSILHATGVLPDEAFVLLTQDTFVEADHVAVQMTGHLEGRERMPVAIRYELRPCEPGLRVRTEVGNRESDPASMLLSDGWYFGGRELLPFAPNDGVGFEMPSFGLSSLGDALQTAPYWAFGGHSEPAASYASVACQDDGLSGFGSSEVTAVGRGPLVVQPRDWIAFERFWTAGEGAGIGPAVDAALEVRRQLFAEEFVTVTGRIEPGEGTGSLVELARASIVLAAGPRGERAAQRPVTQVFPEVDGTFTARVPAGEEYVVRVDAFGRPRTEQAFAATADVDLGVVALDAAGSLTLDATIDGETDWVLAFVLPSDEATREAVSGKFLDGLEECAPLLGHPHGASPACNRILVNGPTTVPILPGTYDVYAAAGLFSTLATARDVVVAPGGDASATLTLQTLPLQPPGTVSGDFHIHGGASFDTNIPDDDRVAAFLASRVEVLATTEHDAAADYAEARDRLAADDRLAIMVGTENTGHILRRLRPEQTTPKVVGHWNIWPVDYDPEGPYRGAYWDEGVDPGLLMTRAQERGWNPTNGVAQLNHPLGGSQFGRDFGWGSALELRGDEALPGADDGSLAWLFDFTPPESDFGNADYHAQEVMNGSNNGNWQQYRAFWFWLLNQGMLKAGTANSDSHSLTEHIVGIPRTLVEVDTSVATFDPDAFNAAVRQGRMTGTNGPVIIASTTDAGGGARTPSLDAFAPAADAELSVTVTAPPWVPVDEVRVVVNGAVAHTWAAELAQPPDPFGAQGLLRLQASIPLADIAPSGDAWVLVEAGTPIEPNADLNCDGWPDTGDNNRDGSIDWRDVEGLEEDPGDAECLESSGPLTDPLVPDDRDDPRFLYQAVAPGGFPGAFTNPFVLDRDGDGFDAPGVSP